MILTVVDNNIARGKRGEPSVCPVALALKEQTGQTWLVCGLYASLDRPKAKHYPLPPEAAAFVMAFDMGQRVAPFTFELPIESEVSHA